MRLSEIGLLLLAASAVAGLFLVVTGERVVVRTEEQETDPLDPIQLLERDLSHLMYGPGFRDVPAAPPDTIVRSMDLVDSIPLHQANLAITRALTDNGFGHYVTYTVPGRGLSFICSTPEGDPMRLELNNTSL